MRATTRLSETLKSGKRALTVECRPPRSADPSAVKRMVGYIPASVDAVVVADNHESVTASAISCAALLAAEKTETLLSMVTRDRNRIALESDVLGAAALGVQGFLCLTGLHQTLGPCPAAAGANDIDAFQFSQALSRMTDDGVDFSGKKLNAAPHLFVAATAHPYLKPMELSLLGVKKKIAAGVQVLFTDPITDLFAFTTWMTALCASGYERQVSIIASVRPNELGLVAKLQQIEGVRGIHLLTGGTEQRIGEFIQQAGLA